MRYDDYGFPPYVSVSEKKAKAQKAAAKLKKKNPGIKPVVIEGSKIAKSWWGIAWIKNLESYADYSNRIGRGRSYVRHGAVLDLQIEEGKVTALVQGSRSKPYTVDITIKPLAATEMKHIVSACEGKLSSLNELIEGKFPKDLGELFTIQKKGLFPTPRQISFDCSCPDWASMCKHVAAVLYGIGARLDEDPSLFFILRKIKIEKMISKAVTQKSESLLTDTPIKSRRIMNKNDMADVFGLEIEENKNTKKIKP
ncbi:MAG: hypothetical protein PF518_13570 [Spirochaetaceae bacterium]|jgi:uncharacterized Zn finger protein|nr:hypothetical protein [Spirochaetaceae bacterium]